MHGERAAPPERPEHSRVAHLAGGPSPAVVVLLVDTPWVGDQAVARLIAAHLGGSVAAQATYAGAPGHPVLLGRQVWDDVAGLAVGDQGARGWLRTHRDLVLHLPLRYEDHTRLTPLADVLPGVACQIEGTVIATEIHYRPRRQLVTRLAQGPLMDAEATVADPLATDEKAGGS